MASIRWLVHSLGFGLGNSTVCGASNTPASLANWKIAMASNFVPGWYVFDATYDGATATSAICNNNATVDPKW